MTVKINYHKILSVRSTRNDRGDRNIKALLVIVGYRYTELHNSPMSIRREREERRGRREKGRQDEEKLKENENERRK